MNDYGLIVRGQGTHAPAVPQSDRIFRLRFSQRDSYVDQHTRPIVDRHICRSALADVGSAAIRIRFARMAWRGTPDEAVVYAAAGMVAAQTHGTEDDAVVKIVEHAAKVSRTVADTARLIMAGVIRFDT